MGIKDKCKAAARLLAMKTQVKNPALNNIKILESNAESRCQPDFCKQKSLVQEIIEAAELSNISELRHNSNTTNSDLNAERKTIGEY